MTLKDKMKKYKTVGGVRCAKCANPFWFDKETERECTACGSVAVKIMAKEVEVSIGDNVCKPATKISSFYKILAKNCSKSA